MKTRAMRFGRYSVQLSSEDKILFPKTGTYSAITKGELIAYYRAIAPHMLALMKDHPITLHRFIEGITEEGFYQKNASDYFPSWIPTQPVENSDGSITNYVLCDKAATLVYLANQYCITFHQWLSTTAHINTPNRLIFDLDPGAAKNSFKTVCTTALELKALLEEHHLKPFVMTTGSRGLHVTVPLKPIHDFDDVREFARKIAGQLAAKHPTLLTNEIRKEKRQGRLFIDVMRNAFGQTAVTPYAVRALPGAPIATPLHWHELNDRTLTPTKYTIHNLLNRIDQVDDPWVTISRYKGVISGISQAAD